MKKIIMSSLLLTIVSSLAAWTLSMTYRNTKPRIDAFLKEEARKARTEVLPEASEFESVSTSGQEYFIGYDDKGKRIGAAIKTNIRGYSAPIEMLTGFNMTGEITRVKILKQEETPGLGARIMEKWFIDQFSKLKEENLSFRRDNPKGKIDGITAATISSRAVVEGAKKSFALYGELLTYLKKMEIVKYVPDGTYVGEGKGFSGPIRVSITLRNHRILEIAILEQQEVVEYWSKVKETVPKKILEKQNIDVDAVSGATYSSKGLIEAVSNALGKGLEK